MGNIINPELRKILNQMRNDQEVSVSISFDNENAAKSFNNLANQVAFDTTLNFEAGEENIASRLRQFAAQKEGNMNTQLQGKQVEARFSKEVLDSLDRCGMELGVNNINNQQNYGYKNETGRWMLDL